MIKELSVMLILMLLALGFADARVPQVGDQVSIETSKSGDNLIEGQITDIEDGFICLNAVNSYDKSYHDVCVGIGSIVSLKWSSTENTQQENQSKLVTLTLYVHEGDANGPIVSDARVKVLDGLGNSFEQTTDSRGSAMITGIHGAWSFSVVADGYETNSWSQPIANSCAKHAFLQKVKTQQKSIAPKTQDSESCPESCVYNRLPFSQNSNEEALKFYENATQCFENAVQQNPNNAECWYHLGNALHNSGNRLQDIRQRYDDANQISQFEDAIKALDRATELDPQLKYAWNEKGVIFEQQGKFDEAVKCFDKAIEIDPAWSVPRNNKNGVLGKS